MIHIVNRHWQKGPGEWIDRKHSPLGNPYSHLAGTTAKYKVATRDEAVDCYRPWLIARLAEKGPEWREFKRLVDKYVAEGTLTLVCWCNPSRCHGEVLREFILLRAGHTIQ